MVLHGSASPFVARRAIVASPHQLATAAGVEVLARGGNAVDAMIATNATLGVVLPHMTGAGGDAFWLIYDASARTVHVLNATGRAAAAATIERYSEGGAARIEPRGPRAVLTVPGAVDGWWQAHSRHGRIAFAECLAPAIGYAEDGSPVSRSFANWASSSRRLLQEWPDTARVFLKPDGATYREGESFRNRALARTLEAIAAGGRDAFYDGAIATATCAALAAGGGVLSPDDFAAHRSDWVAPVEIEYRGRRVVNPPPNSQGFAALQILGILSSFDVEALAERPDDYVDLVVRATQLAFADRDRYLTDPTFSQIPLDELLSRQYLAGLADRVKARKLVVDDGRRPAPIGGDTTFSCAVDGDGNAVAVIQSLYFEWGSGVVAGDTGLLLQNRGTFFSLDPNHVNRLEPGKRTFHTLAAGMALAPDGTPELLFGAMGGEGQPQTQVALVTRVLDHGLDVQAAINAPRWLYGRTWGEEHRGLRLEGRFGEGVAGELAARGHLNVQLVEPWTELMGHAQAIHVRSERLEGGADPRGDGAALGL